jgi:hypothetical protein
MAKINDVDRVFLSGGIIGTLISNPAKNLEKKIKEWNTHGWYCRQILPSNSQNILLLLLQIIALVCTFGLWTFGMGFILLFEKDTMN